MHRKLLQIVSVLLIVIGVSAFAQDRAVPQTQQTVMLSYAPIVKRVSPAVVNIYTKRVVTQRINPFINDPVFRQFFDSMQMGGLSKQQVENSLGSGVIIESNGVIVTNSHVIQDAQEISVVLSDGREFDAKVSLVDKRSDLAILRVDAKGESLPYATLKPSEKLEVGDIVIAIGNPFGVGQTVTSGIVSALARSSFTINDFNFFIQTDAAINPGNSGGPLVDMNGGVIGINTAIFSRDGGSLGIGFAIPSEMVATVVAAEKAGNHNTKSIPRTWLGIDGQPVTAEIAESLGLNRPTGVLVTRLHKESPARKEGMEVGDVITAINDRVIHDGAEMKFRLATIPLGEEAKIDVLRKGKEKSFTVKTVAPPEVPARDERTISGKNPLSSAKVANLNPAVSIELGLKEDVEGVVVTEVASDRQVSRLLRAGDIIASINDRPIQSVKQLQGEIDNAVKAGVMALVLQRNGQNLQIVLR